jgi:D-psicose/D-tagatose/L-ribulose 3-epimerase
MRNNAMRIGCCVNMVATAPDGIGLERLETLAAVGYDYVELPLAQMMELTSAKFNEVVGYVESSGISCEACNNFVPANHPITGDKVDKVKLGEYIDEALERADKLGAKSIVFGSSGAKNAPQGFSMVRAWEQIVETLLMVDEKIEKRDIKIAIEPLCKLESNIVVNAHEGLQLAKEVNRENIRLLIDYYHLSIEREDQCIIETAKNYLQHMHIANPTGRVFPLPGDCVDYRGFISRLKKAGYDSRISIEAYTDDFEASAPLALKRIRDECK